MSKAIAVEQQQPAVITPTADFLLTGGGSIFVVVAVMLIGVLMPDVPWLNNGFDPVAVMTLQFLLNMPHFLASYPLLYKDQEHVARHRFVALYLPFFLVALCIYAVLTPDMGLRGPGLANSSVVHFFGVTTTLLLAWHYTGQSWGMVASFSFISGIRIDKTERALMRIGLHALLVWHLLWGLRQMFGPLEPDPATPTMAWVDSLRVAAPQLFPLVEQAYNVWSIVALLTIPVGVAGFVRLYRRTGKRLPWRVVAPWAATYFWYLLLWAHPGVFLLVQIFHAVQYLGFPFRVEANEFVQKNPDQAHRQRAHVFIYYLVLFGIGLVIYGVPQLAVFMGDKGLAIHAIVAGFVNLHHYFIDGVIWKIRNPRVQRAIFAHLKPAA